MAFHRDHIMRFLVASSTSPQKDEEILARLKAAIGDYSDENTGKFSGGRLDEVIGDPELVTKFNTMWEAGQLQR